jgi:SAM-dependent methyltransferase
MGLHVVAENPIESVLQRLGLLPASVVRVVWGFTVARTLVAAAELGVFEALAETPKSARALADELGCDDEGMRTLMSALNGFGLVRRAAGVFKLKKEAKRYLTSHGTDMTPALRMGVVLDRKMGDMAAMIRTGKRPDFHEHLDDDEWDAYLAGLGSMSGMATGEIVRKVKLDEPRRLLDVAGGHGQFSVALCKAHPELRSEILDLPGGVKVGERLVAESEVADRIQFRSGDLREVEWGEGYDAVLLFNILHNLPADDAAAAVSRAHDALKPGGKLAVLEGQHAGGDGDLSFQEGFGELFFWVLSYSETWPASTIRGWLDDAGFARVSQKKMLTLPGAVLLQGTRAA